MPATANPKKIIGDINAGDVIIGRVTYVIGQLVQVTFDSLPYNTESARGMVYSFKIDIGKTRFNVGDFVVVSFGTGSLRYDSLGNLLVQGTAIGNGAHIEKLENAADKEKYKTFLTGANKKLQHTKDVNLKLEQGKPVPLPPAKPLQILTDIDKIKVEGLSPSWQAVPVPLPVMEEEWEQSGSYLRIGYVSFILESPVEEIQVAEVTPSDSISTLRSRTPIQKNNWHASQQVTISFTLYGEEAENSILLPITRMARKLPFVPIYNTLLFEYGITAITIASIQVTTVPGFPNAMKAVLTGYSFNWQAYLPMVKDFSGYDQQICYPLLKLWVEKPLGGHFNSYTPIGERWNGVFQISHPSESWLKSTDEFTQLADKAQRTNDDIEAAERIVKWRDGAVETDTTGFTPAAAFRDIDKNQITMRGNAARIKYVSIERTERKEVSFIRVKNEKVADALLKHKDTIAVYLGVPSFTPLNPDVGGDNFYEESLRTTQNNAHKDQTRERLGNRDPNILALLNAGSITFAVHTHSKVFDQIARSHKTPIPAEPSPDPVPDLTEVFAPSSMIVEQMSCQFSNIIAQQQVRDFRTPTHQYLGSSATIYNVAATLTDQLEIGHMERFLETVNRLGRQYKGKLNGSPFGGFVFVDNEFFHFMGTKTCLIMSFSSQTIPDFPGAVRFEMQLIEFDPTQRRREVLEDLFADFTFGDMKVVAGLNTATADARITSQQDSFKIRYVRQQNLNSRLRKIELYPDLSLPLHSELSKWVTDIQNDNVWDFDENIALSDEYAFLNFDNGGTGWDWSSADLPVAFKQIGQSTTPLPVSKPDRFADPDFFVGASQPPSEEWVEHVVKISKEQEITISDPYGYEAKIKVGQPITENNVTKNREGIEKTKKDIQDGKFVKPQGSDFGIFDGIDLEGITQKGITPTSSIPNSNALSFSPATTTDRPAPIANADDKPYKQKQQIYGKIAVTAAKKFGIPFDLLCAHLEQESHWTAKIDGPPTKYGTARGMGQILPSTGVGLGVPVAEDLYDPVTNIFATAKYIARLRKLFQGHPNEEILAIAAYNSGPGAVQKYGYTIPPYEETKQYVKNVVNHRANYKLEGQVVIGNKFASRIEDTTGEGRQIFHQMGQGYGYKLEDLMPYVIKKPGEESSKFDARWFRKVVNTGHHTHFTVWASFMPQFIAAKNKHKIPLKLVKVNEFLPGKNVYDHTANSVAADNKVLNELSLRAFNIFSNVAAISQTIAAEREGLSALDVRHIRAEIIRKGVSAEEILSDLTQSAAEVKQDVENAAAFYGTIIGGGSIADAVAAEKDPGLTIAEMQAAEANHGPGFTPPSMSQAFHDPIKRDKHGNVISGGHDIFHDMRKEITAGRLISAFPTFYVAVVDGGRWLRVWRLFDHVYGMLAVTRIAVNRTRKSPIETAVVGFSNMYGHLTAQAVETDRQKANSTQGIWTMDAVFRGIGNAFRPEFNEETLAMWAKHIDSLMLKPGARLHIRLGMGADASQLPVVFNGVISEVPVQEGEVEVVALSDGVELTNDIPPTDLQGTMPVTRLTSSLGGGIAPRELIMQFLAPTNFLDNVANLGGSAGQQHLPGNLSGFFYYLSSFRNAYGIEHFGVPYRLGITFDDAECGVNVYNPEHSEPFSKSTASDSVGRIFQPLKWGTTTQLLGINMTNATPWEIFTAVRKTIPEYILYAEPFELRSTLFMGKGWFPIFTNYRQDLPAGGTEDNPFAGGAVVDREKLFDWKPFQQLHLIHSGSNLIGNTVIADSTDVVTKVQSVGTYSGWNPLSFNPSIEASFIMQLDSDIYDEFQKQKIVESGLYTTPAMKHTDDSLNTFLGVIQLAGALIPSPFRAKLAAGGASQLVGQAIKESMLSRRIMDYHAAMTLKDHVKDMYQGSLICLGSPYFKPYDFVAVVDNLNGMNGVAEIKSCTHTMSLETGFVTEVNPDCVTRYCADTEGTDLVTWVYMVSNHFIAALSSAFVVGILARRISPYFALSSLKKIEKFLTKHLKDEVNGQVLGKAKQITVDALAGVRIAIGKVGRAGLTNNNLKIKAAFEELATLPSFKEVLGSIPFFTKSELIVQQVLRKLPNVAVGSTVSEVAASIKEFGYLKNLELQTTVVAASEKAAGDLEAAQQLLAKFRPADIRAAEKALKVGGAEAAAVDGELAEGIKILHDAQKAFDLKQLGLNTVTKVLSVETTLKSLVSDIISPKSLLSNGTQVLFVVCGGVSDYITRWAVSQQCLTLWCLKVYDKELSAGITGHRGSVAGDNPGILKSFFTGAIDFFKSQGWISNFLPIISDVINQNVQYRHGEPPRFFK